MVKLLRHEDYAVVPWKNGGGVTREIAVHADDTSHGDFLWRISMATVSQAGPFSLFEGVDRSIAVLNGAGIVLCSAEGKVILTPESDPFAFNGEAPIDAGVVDGETTDLNAMTRRGRYSHSMEKLNLDRPVILEATADETVLIFNGDVEITTPDEEFTAGSLDALTGLHIGAKVHLSPKGQAEVFVIHMNKTVSVKDQND